MNDTLNKDINKLTLQVFMQTVGSSMVMVYMNLFMTDYLMIAAATVAASAIAGARSKIQVVVVDRGQFLRTSFARSK